MNSHTLNATTGKWDPPFAPPALTEAQQTAKQYYAWDESAWAQIMQQGGFFNHLHMIDILHRFRYN